MKTLKITMLTAAIGVALSASSFASIFDTPNPPYGLFFVPGNSSFSPSDEIGFINARFTAASLPAPNPNFFAREQGGSFQDGTLGNSGNFITVVNSPDGTQATVSWNLTGTGLQMGFILVKDGDVMGDGTLALHLYGVTTDQMTIGTGVVTVNGAGGHMISHISFFGGAGGQVPDSGMTVTLLGASLAGIEVLRRRIASLKR
jgi:VPDSG-CTERM motif